MKPIWITWEGHTRTRTLCSLFDIELHEFSSKQNRLIRHSTALIKTLLVLLRSAKGSTVIVQNPSILLTLISIFYCRLADRRIIVDAHNAGLFPMEGRSKVLNGLARLCVRTSDWTIVTNRKLSEIVELWGGRSFVLPDALPNLDTPSTEIAERPTIAFICTWAEDEPYREVIEACRLFENEADIVITGNFRKALSDEEVKELPKNVLLAGFLSEIDYIRTLGKSWVIMDLTSRENCLVCGAYEAVSLRKPIILSDTKANRNYFDEGVVYTGHQPASICQSMRQAIDKVDENRIHIRNLEQRLRSNWELVRIDAKTQIFCMDDGDDSS